MRSAKTLSGVLAAVTVLRGRYLLRDENDCPVESTGEMMNRVANVVAAAEDDYRRGSAERWAEQLSALLCGPEFLPNSPTLTNAGTGLGLLCGSTTTAAGVVSMGGRRRGACMAVRMCEF